MIDFPFTRACLLGDGCLGLHRGKYPYLSITHSEKQQELLQFKAKRLSKELEREIKVNGPHEYIDDRTGNAYKRVNIHVSHKKSLSKIYSQLYPEGKKLITKSYLEGLGEEALAVFWMDDGGMNRGTNAGYLNLYTDEAQAKICADWIKSLSNGKINAKLHREGIKYRLRIMTSEIHALRELIRPYMIESMNYKLELSYNSSRMTTARRQQQGPPLLTQSENFLLEKMTDKQVTDFMKRKGFNYTKRGSKQERINRIRDESLISDTPFE